MNEEPLKQIERDLDRALNLMVSNYSLTLQIDNSSLKKFLDASPQDWQVKIAAEWLSGL